MSVLGFVALALISQSAQAPDAQKPQAAAVVGQMLQKYYASKETAGTILMTQEYDKHTYSITTNDQFERKYKLYIKQVSSRTPQEVWLASSTGQRFCYDAPPEIDGLIKTGWVDGGRLLESQVFEGRVLEIGDVYHAVSKSIGDRSVPLDIAISHKDDLAYIRNQWKTMVMTGTAKYKNEDVYVISGDWRPHAAAEVRGKYTMYINMKNELKQYSTTELFGYANVQPKPITTTWDVDLKLDAKTDQSLYKIYK